MPSRVIVEHNDDYTAYWDASDDEAWASSAYGLLAQRYDAGYWYDESYSRYAEIVKEVEEGPTWKTVGRGRWERKVPVAWELLDDRSDYEYERVELEDVGYF